MFGELFHEMLQRDFGNKILESLLSYTPEPAFGSAPLKTDKKRAREDTPSDQAPVKKEKSESDVKVQKHYIINVLIAQPPTFR